MLRGLFSTLVHLGLKTKVIEVLLIVLRLLVQVDRHTRGAQRQTEGPVDMWSNVLFVISLLLE